jgi:hypothetical protein
MSGNPADRVLTKSIRERLVAVATGEMSERE